MPEPRRYRDYGRRSQAGPRLVEDGQCHIRRARRVKGLLCCGVHMGSHDDKQGGRKVDLFIQAVSVVSFSEGNRSPAKFDAMH